MYDHTIECVSGKNEKTHFFRKGLAGGGEHGNVLSTLQELLSSNGHNEEKNMILKIDIEGAEWEFLENVGEDVLRGFDQIVFELHEFVTTQNRERILNGLRKLNVTHQCVHIHANNMSSHILEWDRGVLSECIEATYVSNESFLFSNKAKQYSIDKLDHPNLKGVNEIDLTRWI